MRTREQITIENMVLNLKASINILKIQSLEIEVELLKRDNEKLTSKLKGEQNED